MKNWFRKKKKNTENSPTENEPNALWDKAVAIQKAYWTFDQEEKEQLIEKANSSTITFEEIYRLHHLACLELCTANPEPENPVPYGNLKSLAEYSSMALLSQESPYRFSHGSFVLKGAESSAGEEARGHFVNASLTHLGGLEVIKVDESQEPQQIEFIPFDHIRGGVFQGSSLLRPCRLFFEYGREDLVCWVPLLYATSFEFGNEYNLNGSMTNFQNHIHIPQLEMNFGVGLGQQDLKIHGASGMSLVGLGRVSEFSIALQLDDPNFDKKCISRGIDPDEARRQNQ